MKSLWSLLINLILLNKHSLNLTDPKLLQRELSDFMIIIN